MEIKLYNSPKKAFKLILVSSGLVFSAALILVTIEAPAWLWYPSIGVCSLGYPFALFHLFDKRPQIVMNEVGIFDRSTCRDFINWVVIQRAFVADTPAMWTYVCLIVDRKYLESIKKARVVRPFGAGPDEIFISIGLTAVDEVKLTEFIVKMIKAKAEGRKDEFKEKSRVELS